MVSTHKLPRLPETNRTGKCCITTRDNTPQSFVWKAYIYLYLHLSRYVCGHNVCVLDHTYVTRAGKGECWCAITKFLDAPFPNLTA
jgi:hypothetical protein